MLTLTYGLKKPENGDYGSTFFPALAADIVQLDAHNHDGTNSSLISPISIASFVQLLVAANWVATAIPGLYRQLVTIPSGVLYDAKTPFFRETVLGHILFLQVEKFSATQYYVYINDNTLDVTAYYL